MGKSIDWKPEQKKCIYARGGTLLVSAAAGSGKTAVLIERVFSRLVDETDPVDIGELLVVTFTHATADEMKKRLADRIGDHLKDHPNTPGLRRQQLLLPTADVCTMDSFCQNLVRENASTLGLPADFKIAEESQIALLKYDAVAETVEQAFQTNDPVFLDLYASLGKKMLPSTILDFNNSIQSMADPEGFLCAQEALVASDTLPVNPLDLTETEKISDEEQAATVPLIKMFLALVRDYRKRLEEKMSQASMLGFSEVLHATVSLLAKQDEHGAFVKDEAGRLVQSDYAADLSKTYREIYVDEYQDTNELQDTLYRLLSQNEQNLFFVGDTKQSIYGFRHTSPESFIAKREAFTLSGDDEETVSTFPATVMLGRNFRSRKSVVNAVNYLFNQLMQTECGGVAYAENDQLIYGAKDYDETNEDLYRPTLLVIDKGAYTPKKHAADDPILEGMVIAEEIKRMMNDPNVTVTEKGRVTRRPRYSDFCVLRRSVKNAGVPLAATMEACGVPAVTAGNDDGFFDTLEIRWMLSLLRFIDNPLLDVSLLATLMSPLCGLSPDDVVAVRKNGPYLSLYGALTETAKQDTPLGHRCAAFLEKAEIWRTLAVTVPADRLLWDVYERTQILSFCAIGQNGAAREQNLRLLMERARAFEQNGFRGLSAFLRYLDHLQEFAVRTAPAGSVTSCDAVRVMTIHKSKGLEFPFVFVAGTGKEFKNGSNEDRIRNHEKIGVGIIWTNRNTLEKCKSARFTAATTFNGNDVRAEEMRLLYVAATRAKEKLYFVCSVDLQKKTTPLTKAAETVSTLEPETPLLPVTSVASRNSYTEWLFMALLRHPSGDPLREMLKDCYVPPLSDESLWDIRFCHPEPDDLETEETVVFPDSDETLEALLAERFAYKYPHKELSAVPSKLAASAVTHVSRTHEYAATTVPAFLRKDKLTAAEKGTATHAFMQFADWARAAADVEAEKERLVAEGKLTADQADAVDTACVTAFFSHPIYARISKADNVWRELPFTYALSVGDYKKLANVTLATSSEDDHAETLLVQGIADCVFEENGNLVILDYKTDHGKSMETLRDHYAPQLKLYAKALADTLGKPVSTCLVYSFAHNAVIETGTEI